MLTSCLLKSDFNLDVDIPKDRLVPTLPLRLNYILWVEDLMNLVQRKDNIRGLDIGKCYCFILFAVTNTITEYEVLILRPGKVLLGFPYCFSTNSPSVS